MKYFNKKISLLLVLAFIAMGSFAQTHTGYYLEGVPQRHYLNPAFQCECTFYLGMPLFSSLYVENYNNSVTFSDLFWTDPESGDVIHPLHPNADLDAFLENFKERNIISSAAAANFASFGFRAGNMYFTFDATSRTNQFLSYPGELMYFLLKGNNNNQTFDFSNLGFEVDERVEFALGISREFNSSFTVGIKPKFIKGLATVSALDNSIMLNTSTQAWTFNTDMAINMSIPGAEYTLDENGEFDFENGIIIDTTLSTIDDVRRIVKGNNGLGIDLGFVYKPLPEIELSASLIDFGYIKWTNSTISARLSGEYSFGPMELEFSDTTEFAEGLLDSLANSFSFTGEETEFTTYLTPKILVGGRFFFTSTFSAGLVSRVDLLKGGARANLIINANWTPSSVWSLSASYSPVGGTAKTFGLGTSFRVGIFNLYLLTDYFPTTTVMLDGVPVPNQQSNFNIRVGLNLVFGCNQEKKLRKDKPMYYSAEY